MSTLKEAIEKNRQRQADKRARQLASNAKRVSEAQAKWAKEVLEKHDIDQSVELARKDLPTFSHMRNVLEKVAQLKGEAECALELARSIRRTGENLDMALPLYRTADEKLVDIGVIVAEVLR